MLSDGRFWFGVAVGAAALYGFLYWRQRKGQQQ